MSPLVQESGNQFTGKQSLDGKQTMGKTTTKLAHIATMGTASTRLTRYILIKLLHCDGVITTPTGNNLVNVYAGVRSSQHHASCVTACAATMRQIAIAGNINSGSKS